MLPDRPAEEHAAAVVAKAFADGGEFLVGLCDGRVVAAGALRHITDAVAELKRMGVHPAF